MKQILLDMDGVLVNFIDGALKAHNLDRQIIHDCYEQQHPGDWDVVQVINTAGFPITTAEFWRPLEASFWAGLGWMPDGSQILSCVERVFGRDNLCLWTSPSANRGCIPGKLTWIREHLHPHYWKHVIFGHKKQVAAHPNSLLIDDSDANTANFRAAGGNALLVPRIWNSAYPHRANATQYLERCLWTV